MLDLGLPGMSGFELLRKLKDEGMDTIPVVIYTGRELTREQETELSDVSHSIIIKGVSSPERLLEETSVFLHRKESAIPERNRRLLKSAALTDPSLSGRKVLIVDDDVRNIFALVSMLETHNMETCYSENGKDAIELLRTTRGIDAILMDVMMPEMDGYQTMSAIRQMEEFRDIPIIAVTAKAMKGDRDKCIAAGATDYIAKPVEPEELFSLLRVCLADDDDQEESVSARAAEPETLAAPLA